LKRLSAGWWWLRSSNNDNNAFCVDGDGNNNNNHVNNNNGVRPASPRLPDGHSKRNAPVRGAKESDSVLHQQRRKTHAVGETDANGAHSPTERFRALGGARRLPSSLPGGD